jgi:hypothetical protein
VSKKDIKSSREDSTPFLGPATTCYFIQIIFLSAGTLFASNKRRGQQNSSIHFYPFAREDQPIFCEWRNSFINRTRFPGG